MRRSFAVLLGFASIVGIHAAAIAAEETPVALPPFIVEEVAKGPPWRYTESLGYEILSRCSDAVTQHVVEAHYQLHQILAEILPARLQVKMSLPRMLILYDEELQPAASKEVIARMLVNPPNIAGEDVPLASGGRGLRVPATARRFSFLPNLRLWDRDAMAVFMIVRQDDFDPDRLALTQDYVSFMVKTRMPTLPPWFLAGFLAMYQQMTYGDRRLTLGPMEWISEKHTDALKKDPNTAPRIRPLAEFLSSKFGPREPNATFDPVKVWQSQAMLFVRWGLDALGGARRAAFLKFVERSAIEGGTEKVFQECFDLDFAAAEAELAAYLPNAVRRTVQFRPAKLAKLPPLALRNATDGQIARMKGDWERMEVPYVKALSPNLEVKYLEQARRTLRRGYDRGDRDPRLLAVLGLCESDAGNDTEAREYLEAATRIGAMRPRAYYELARLRLAEFRASPAGEGGRISVPQAVAVLQPLFAARDLDPPLPEVYELIAEVWARAASAPTRRHLAVLDEGVRLFPRRTNLVLRTAELYMGQGFRDEAATFLAVGMHLADDDAARERVATLQQQLAAK